MTGPLISIVIPTYNRRIMAERLIRSILKSTYTNLEIIIIDDASIDGTSIYLKKKFPNHSGIRIFRNQINLFASGSKNRGQSKAKGEFIAFIDDDNVVDRMMIEELVKIMLEDKSVGEAGPVNYNFNKKNKVLLAKSTRNMWTTKTYHLRSLKDFHEKIWRTDDIPNAFMVRSEVLLKNKIEFNPKFGIMYEESDFAYRIRKSGYKIVMVKDAKIYHDIEDLLSKNESRDYLYHFMDDKRRPFVFARNRVIFHSIYSNKLQKLFIFSFWIWLFSFYYMYKFIFYKGYGVFSIVDRLQASLNYLKGTFNGISLVISGNNKM